MVLLNLDVIDSGAIIADAAGDALGTDLHWGGGFDANDMFIVEYGEDHAFIVTAAMLNGISATPPEADDDTDVGDYAKLGDFAWFAVATPYNNSGTFTARTSTVGISRAAGGELLLVRETAMASETPIVRILRLS